MTVKAILNYPIVDQLTGKIDILEKDKEKSFNLEYAPSLAEARLQELTYIITQEVMYRLNQKSLRDFAKGQDFDAPQLSRWLRGTYNLSLKSIAKLEVALGEPLLMICGRPSKEFLSAGLPGSSESAVKVDVPEALLSPSFQFQARKNDDKLAGNFRNFEMNTEIKHESVCSQQYLKDTSPPAYRYAQESNVRARTLSDIKRRKIAKLEIFNLPS